MSVGRMYPLIDWGIRGVADRIILGPIRPSLSWVATPIPPAGARTVDGAKEARIVQGWARGGDMSPANVYIGIDVAKDWLDVAQRPGGEAWRVSSDATGIATLVKRLKGLRPALVVLEATGGLE